MYNNNYSYIKGIKQKYQIPNKTVKRHNRVNNVMNIGLTVGLTMPFVLGYLPLSTTILILCGGYVGYDILGMVADKAVIGSHLLSTKMQRKGLVKQFAGFSRKEQEEMIKEMNELAEKYEWDGGVDNNVAAARIKADIEACQQAMNEYVDEDKKIEDVLNAKGLSDLERARNSLEQMKIYKSSCPNQLKDLYGKLIKEAKDLLDLAEEKPYIMDKLNKTFNIYFPELASLIIAYKEMKFKAEPSETDEMNEKNIGKIMKQFEEHLSDLKEQIQTEGKMKFDISYNLLKESLSKDKTVRERIKREEEDD